MQVIPVLDLAHGRAVHARRGARDAYRPVISELAPGTHGDPLALARSYRTGLGLDVLYVADLDAIGAGIPQRPLWRALAGVGAELWVDAGVGSADRALDVLASGAAQVVIGLETLPAPGALAEVVQAAGASHVVFSLDLCAGEPVARASALADHSPLTLAALAAEAGVRTMIVLDLARVGTGAGVDLALVHRIRRELPELALIAGGGIGGREDLVRLADVGVAGALVATALHEGRITRAELDALRARSHPEGE